MSNKWKFYNIDAETISICGCIGKDTVIDIPERIGNTIVTEIAEQAFSSGSYYDRTNIQGVTIPYGVRKIGKWAFKNCSSLKKISLPCTLEEMEHGVFCGCTALTDVELPHGLKIIGDYVFMGCRSLTKVIIPSTIENIGEGVFNYYSFEDPLVRSVDVDRNYINPKLTIITEEGSEAAKYAYERGIKIIAT